MTITELVEELYKADDPNREVVVEDQDGRLLAVDMVRDQGGTFALIAGEETVESRRL